MSHSSFGKGSLYSDHLEHPFTFSCCHLLINPGSLLHFDVDNINVLEIMHRRSKATTFLAAAAFRMSLLFSEMDTTGEQ